MKRLTLAFALVALAGPTVAQPAAKSDPQTPAVVTQDSVRPAAPAKGANSFTETQARTRISDAGFSDITALAIDNDGVWRGKATKRGTEHDVALDYKGNVFPSDAVTTGVSK